jgi:hypothetical protein
VASITDSGVGALDVTFSTAFSSANYAAVVGAKCSASFVDSYTEAFAQTTTGVTFAHLESNALADPASRYFAIFGEQ